MSTNATVAQLVQRLNRLKTTYQVFFWIFLAITSWESLVADLPSGVSLTIIGVGLIVMFRYFFVRQSIAAYQNPEFLGHLLEMYVMELKSFKKTMMPSIVQALRQANQGHYDAMDSQQRLTLQGLISINTPIPMLTEIVGCVKRCAGPEAIPFIEKFVATVTSDSKEEFIALANVARLSIPEVRIREARSIIEKTLSSEMVSGKNLGSLEVPSSAPTNLEIEEKQDDQNAIQEKI